MPADVVFGLREVAVILGSVNLGDEIRDARERLRMTQPELAERVGVHESTVSNWERGKSVPKNRLALVVQVLNMADRDTTSSLESEEAEQEGDVVFPLRDATTMQVLAELARRHADLESEVRALRAELDRAQRGENRPELRPELQSGMRAELPQHLRMPPQTGGLRSNDG